jgi:hypothetical protein
MFDWLLFIMIEIHEFILNLPIVDILRFWQDKIEHKTKHSV